MNGKFLDYVYDGGVLDFSVVVDDGFGLWQFGLELVKAMQHRMCVVVVFWRWTVSQR